MSTKEQEHLLSNLRAALRNAIALRDDTAVPPDIRAKAGALVGECWAALASAEDLSVPTRKIGEVVSQDLRTHCGDC